MSIANESRKDVEPRTGFGHPNNFERPKILILAINIESCIKNILKMWQHTNRESMQ